PAPGLETQLIDAGPQPVTPETQPSVAEQPLQTTEQPSQITQQTPQLQDGMNPACRREIVVEIPAEVARRHWEGLIQSYAKRARVPGFRHGKVPASIIRSRFGQEIKSEVLESLVPAHFREVVLKEGLKPISQPLVRDLEMEEGQPIRFKATFEVVPEIELGQYQEINVEKPETAISDAEIENEIRRLQEERTSFDPVDEDRPLQDGDFAQISFTAKPKAAPAPQGEPSAAQGELTVAQGETPVQEAAPSSEPVAAQGEAP